jgi:hypothetical protein
LSNWGRFVARSESRSILKHSKPLGSSSKRGRLGPPPELEFEVNHLHTERVREWGLALSYGLPIAVGAGLGGSFLLFIGPVRWFVAALEIIGIVVAMVLTVWGHSKWRLKRSLRKMSRQDA